MQSLKKKPPSLEYNSKPPNLLRFENEAHQKGFRAIAGIDEAGRGPLAGPVVAAACMIPHDLYIPGVNDSKKLSPRQREHLFETIISNDSIQYGIGIVSPQEIDQINILQATICAMINATNALPSQPDMLLVDGLQLPHSDIPCQKIIKGDSLSQSIAAASILAKVTRDKLMVDYHTRWPHYGFDKHKGYGTRKHLEAIKQYGACEIHRMSFAPLNALSFSAQ